MIVGGYLSGSCSRQAAAAAALPVTDPQVDRILSMTNDSDREAIHYPLLPAAVMVRGRNSQRDPKPRRDPALRSNIIFISQNSTQTLNIS